MRIQIMSDRPVYSTARPTVVNERRKRSRSATSKRSTPSPTSGKWQVSQGPSRYRLERKGRGGKVVTVLFELPMDEPTAVDLCKDLQNLCATGGGVKNRQIELQGDQSKKIIEYFNQQGWRLVQSGG